MSSNTNKVELLGYYGSDKIHALSAWTSTSRKLTNEKEERLPKLLHDLASSGHETPFEKSMLHFLVTTDLATHIHLCKHRIGVSINSESPRYKEMKEDKFYVPVDWDEEECIKYISFVENAQQNYHETLKRLVSKGFSRKRAKESARFYLPYGNQLTVDISFNFRSFNHFLNLRYSEHAQLEVRNIAKGMLQETINIGVFEHTLSAFKLTKSDGTICDPFDSEVKL